MSMAISGASVRIHLHHNRTAHFGALKSEEAHGDIDAAQAAADLNLAPAASDPGPAQTPAVAVDNYVRVLAMVAKAKGAPDSVNAAIASGDHTAARKALTDFLKARFAKAAEPAPAPETAPVTDTSSTDTSSDAGMESPAPTADTLALLSGSGRPVDLLLPSASARIV
ncbi:MAG: hypothetical protein JF595_05815 [Sphingomonadales bacterium]|nr:hypothetical protein [Sphingomonadales bacterium]